MLDIIFLNLHRRYLNREISYGGFLGIYLLSAFVNQEGYNAKSFAGTLEKGLNIVNNFCSTEQVSMIGLYCDFDNVTENIFLCSYIKDHYNLPVIIGGPQATALDKSFFINSKCDAVVRYEGELTVLELMNFFIEDVGTLSDILGITYLDGDKLRFNPERPLIRNLDALPFITESCYIDPDHHYRSGLSLMTGRGCPFHCAFCHEGAHTKAVRLRSVDNVLAEIDAYLKTWGKDDELYILFTDDTFTLSADRVKNICKGLAERRKCYNFKFFCEGHVHTIYKNPDMIKDLVAGGCVRIQLGIEAGTSQVLQAYGKNTNPNEILEVIKICRDSGIQQVFGNIILGGADFSRQIFDTDKAFVNKIIREGQGIVEIGVVTYWPLPETRMTRCPNEFGINICDSEFLTSVGDFPQIETAELDRLTIAEMERSLRQEILDLMASMLEQGQVPTERILSWFPKSDKLTTYSMWFTTLINQKILYAYYEMMKLGEGIPLSQTGNILTAHPIRVVPLFQYLKRVDSDTAEICGEIFADKELEVVLLTTGKLTIEEISKRVSLTITEVVNVLQRLENHHLVIFSLH